MVYAIEKLNKKNQKLGEVLFEEIGKEIELKKEKGLNPSGVLISPQNYFLLLSFECGFSPIRSGIYYTSVYGIRLDIVPFVNETFFQVVCSDEVRK